MPRKCREVSLLLLLWNLIFKINDTATVVLCLRQSTTSSKTRRTALQDLSKNIVSISSAALIALETNPLPGHALTPQEASKAYDSYAASYDDLDGGKAADILGLDQARSTLFGQARGAVLEIGVGTGLNLEKYDPSKLESLTLVDVSQGMLGEAKKRIKGIPSLQRIPVKFIQADATSSELVDRFGANSFDTVVDSFSFCVMGTQGAKNCLEQMKQVVKTKANNGQILLLENTRSSNPLLGIYQDATAETVASAGGKGCVYNQDVTKMIQASSGIELVEENSFVNGFFRSYLCRVSS